MPSKQELMEIMENRLPGETLPISNTAVAPPAQPPAYPDLEKSSYASPPQAEQTEQMQQQQQHQFQPAAPATVYTIRQPAITFPPAQFGTRSHLAFCPSCHATQMTRCEYQSSMMTHIIATILCFTTCLCCCLPYFFDNCKSARHYCQNCGSYLGGHTK